MRCCACNKNLNDYESTLRSAVTGEYLDTCNKCLSGLGIEVIDREDLGAEEQVEDDSEFFEQLEEDE